MRYIKTFENLNDSPGIGDYVVMCDDMKSDTVSGVNFENFINSNVGRISDIRKDTMNRDMVYDITYLNIPTDIMHMFQSVVKNNGILTGLTTTWFPEDVIFFSNIKEDVEAFLNSKKYNL